MTTANAAGSRTAGLPPKVRAALTRYRVMAYVTGTLLIVLTVAFALKYTVGGDTVDLVTSIAGFAHGWLFIVYLCCVADLAIKARLAWRRVLVIAICGTIPVLTFVAERWTVRTITGGF